MEAFLLSKCFRDGIIHPGEDEPPQVGVRDANRLYAVFINADGFVQILVSSVRRVTHRIYKERTLSKIQKPRPTCAPKMYLRQTEVE